MSEFNAICPKCGALQSVECGEDAANCTVCGKAFIVEKALNAFAESMKNYNAVCSKCGALLSVDADEDAANCPKCGRAFIVEKAMQAFEEKYPTKGDNGGDSNAPMASPMEDFEINDGVLESYLGEGGDVVIPGCVREIGREAFWNEGGESVSSVYIPEGVVSIGVSAFMGCQWLENVYIPKSVKSIGAGVFSSCDEIYSITVAEGNPRYRMISGCLVDTETKTLIATQQDSSIPADGSVTAIGDCAFCGASWLKGGLVIPEGIRKIGYEAFMSALNITSVTIPASVRIIEAEAFCETEALSEVIFENKHGWTYNGEPVEIPYLGDYQSVDDFIGKYGFDHPLIRCD